MNLRFWARQRRFWHCLIRFHRAITLYEYPPLPTRLQWIVGGKCVFIGCECGAMFWGLRPELTKGPDGKWHKTGRIVE